MPKNVKYNLLFQIAKLANRYALIGKGAIPRLLGTFIGKNYFLQSSREVKYSMDNSSLDVFVHMANNQGKYNEEIVQQCIKYLRNGNVFYDIGANIGYVSMEVAKHFKDEVKIYAIEPQKNLSDKIEESIRINDFKNVFVLDCMIGDELKIQKLFLAPHLIHASAIPRKKTTRFIRVKMETLDHLVENKMIMPPDLMKIDVEGGELQVFKGAQNTIKKFKPIILFESDQNMRRFNYSQNDVLTFLSELADYDYFVIDPKGRGKKLSNKFEYGDILAVPK